MSDFRFGNDYKLNAYPQPDYGDDWDFDNCERVEVEGVTFVRERTCRNDGRNYGCLFHCTECGRFIDAREQAVINFNTLAFNFCPNCGAWVISE